MNEPNTNHLRDTRPSGSFKLLRMAFLFQGSLALIGLAAAWLFDFRDPEQPILDLRWKEVLLPAVGWGVLGTLPLLLYLAATHFLPIGPIKHIRNVVEQRLYPLLKDCSISDIIWLSLLAGVTEEILFRWCIQGGLEVLIGGQWGWLWALMIASTIFGLMHAINASYAFLTTIVGAYLGWLMIWTGTYIAPAVTHFLFDLIALYYVVRILPRFMTLPSEDDIECSIPESVEDDVLNPSQPNSSVPPELD